MTQPERPGRAAAEQLRQDQVAAQLRHAAHSYEPDGDRIRRLIDARVASTGGTPVKASQTRGLGGRTVLWPVFGSAAAAAVILAVAASGAPDVTTPPDGPVVVGTDGQPSPAQSRSGEISSPTSTTAVVQPPSTAAPTAGRTATGHNTTTSTTTVTGGAGPGKPLGGPAAPPGREPATATTSGSVAGRSVTAVVQSVPGARQVTLGASGQVWALAGTSTTTSTASAANPTAVGPIQGLANGAVSEPGPFTVRWQNGTPQATGTTSSWLVVPAVAASPNQALAQVPVRFKTDSFTAVLYVGTFGGGGRLQIGAGGQPLRVSLPGCGQATCASVVTITSRGAHGVPTTGDLPVQLFSEGATKVAIAAASLG